MDATLMVSNNTRSGMFDDPVLVSFGIVGILGLIAVILGLINLFIWNKERTKKKQKRIWRDYSKSPQRHIVVQGSQTVTKDRSSDSSSESSIESIGRFTPIVHVNEDSGSDGSSNQGFTKRKALAKGEIKTELKLSHHDSDSIKANGFKDRNNESNIYGGDNENYDVSKPGLKGDDELRRPDWGMVRFEPTLRHQKSVTNAEEGETFQNSRL